MSRVVEIVDKYLNVRARVPADVLELCEIVETLQKENEQLKQSLKNCLTIVQEAYWDEYSASKLPGAGYYNKAQHIAGTKWRSSENFKEWIKKVHVLVGEEE